MQPESPTSPPASRTGASRGRSLNLGISIPAELLQDSDARITLQAATLRALSDAHSFAFEARTWELLNKSDAVKLGDALLAGWDVMMALLPTYTPLALQQQLYETDSTSGLHAADWVSSQAEQVGWFAATEQFCYHDAVSLAHCLSSPVADLNRVAALATSQLAR